MIDKINVKAQTYRISNWYWNEYEVLLWKHFSTFIIKIQSIIFSISTLILYIQFFVWNSKMNVWN